MSDLSPEEQRTWLGADAGMPAPPGWPAPAPEPPRDPRAGRRRNALIIAGALTLSLVLALGAGINLSSRPHTSTFADGSPAQGASAPTTGIVDINTYTKVLGRSQLVPEGAGSGMVLTATGEVLTNNHVVKGAWKIEATVPGGETYTASVVGVDPTRDVALLQLADASGLATITPGDASTVSLGDQVAGVGNALGRGGAPDVATGVVTGLDRSITAQAPGGSAEKLTGLIQTNAHIQPGDSGGALVNAQGQVVGMVTAGNAIQSGQGSSGPTTGFAIPINNALIVVDQISSGTGDPSVVLLGERGYLGVQVQNLDQAAAARFGVTQGALVAGLDPNGQAGAAGIEVPSVITAVDGQPVTSAESLGPLLHVHVPGDTVQVQWVDASGSHSASIQLVTGPAV
jgi:S1-C subfamily serine protease